MEENSPKQPAKGGKISEFLHSRRGETIILSALSAFALLFTLIFYSVDFTEHARSLAMKNSMSFWSADFLVISKKAIKSLNTYLGIAFAVDAVLYALAWLWLFARKKPTLFFVSSAFGAVFCVVCLTFGALAKAVTGGAIFCCVLSILFSGTALGYLLVRRRRTLAEKAAAEEDGDPEEPETALTPAQQKKYGFALLVCDCVAFLVLFTLLFVPLYSGRTDGASYILISALGSDTYPIYVSIGLIAAIALLFGETLFFISTVSDYGRGKAFAERAKRFVLNAATATLLFFILGYSLAFAYNLGATEKTGARHAYTISYIPFILAVADMIICSIFAGKLPRTGKRGRIRKQFKLEPLLAVAILTGVTYATLATKIIEIRIIVPVASVNSTVGFTGYELLSMYKSLESGFQVLAFLEMAVLLISGILLILTLTGFLSKDNSYQKLIRISSVTNFMFVLLLGLFGLYFDIAQKINIEEIKSILAYYNITFTEEFVYEASGQAIYMLIASGAILLYMIARKLFSVEIAPVSGIPADAESAGEASTAERDGNAAPAETQAEKLADFDVCPAFTEIDGLQDKFLTALENRRQHLFANPTLPTLIRFLVDYARESRLHLSYTPEDIATFVAGLGASRLAILQGMSGTGKTSLPKIFTEALMSNCEIVEVESSWRDKNELLGYYNEFSKCYTPKKFTQCLYKARLNNEVITFIVLDEMNLSRIEYYFSDFLSLMENEEDKREIKLLNVKLSRTEKGKKIQYDGLKNGHTITIPTNVWFIGTANRDESTFEISDKVYDRAQTMNFDKRAPKIHSYSRPLEQRYVPYSMLKQLFDEAIAGYKFEAEDNRLIAGAEKALAPFNISFGNRILRQMETFVKIYCACFGNQAAVENDAVESILLSKVVHKLENKVVENKEKLAVEFDKMGLKKCGAFIRKLNED